MYSIGWALKESLEWERRGYRMKVWHSYASSTFGQGMKGLETDPQTLANGNKVIVSYWYIARWWVEKCRTLASLDYCRHSEGRDDWAAFMQAQGFTEQSSGHKISTFVWSMSQHKTI